MKIVFVARRYWPAVGGVETFIRHLANELADRHEMIVLAQRADSGPANRLSDSLRPPPTFEPFWDRQVQVRPLRISAASRILLAPLYSQIMPVLRRYAYGRSRVAAARLYALVVAPLIGSELVDADIVHMFGGDLMAEAVVRAGRRAGIPVVITPFAHRHQWGDDRASAGAYRRAGRIIALLEWDAALYRDLGVASTRISTCGVCTPPLTAGGGRAVRASHGINGPLVLYLGVRRAYKGVDLLLEAAERVSAERPDTTFAFVGPGPRLHPSGSQARILDIGLVTEPERAAWLAAADLLCLPSHGEIFPLSLLEAWSLGTPVVTTELPPLRELISKSGGGITVAADPDRLAQAISRLLSDDQRRAAMGAAGRMFWSAHHTVPAIARWHEGLYRSMVGAEAIPCAI